MRIAEVNTEYGLTSLGLEGHGYLINRLRIRITRVTIWVIGVINLLTKSP